MHVMMVVVVRRKIVLGRWELGINRWTAANGPLKMGISHEERTHFALNHSILVTFFSIWFFSTLSCHLFMEFIQFTLITPF